MHLRIELWLFWVSMLHFSGDMLHGYIGIMRSHIMPFFWDLILANLCWNQMGLMTFWKLVKAAGSMGLGGVEQRHWVAKVAKYHFETTVHRRCFKHASIMLKAARHAGPSLILVMFYLFEGGNDPIWLNWDVFFFFPNGSESTTNLLINYTPNICHRSQNYFHES